MFTVQEIRKSNLAALLNQANVTAIEFSISIGMQPSYLSQILSAKAARNIGEKLSRKIEKKLKLQKGWMDRPHLWDSPVGMSMELNAKVTRFIAALHPEARNHLEALIGFMAPEGYHPAE